MRSTSSPPRLIASVCAAFDTIAHEQMTNYPEDRHVLAAAVVGGAAT